VVFSLIFIAPGMPEKILTHLEVRISFMIYNRKEKNENKIPHIHVQTNLSYFFYFKLSYKDFIQFKDDDTNKKHFFYMKRCSREIEHHTSNTSALYLIIS